jgi:hypothetical protein
MSNIMHDLRIALKICHPAFSIFIEQNYFEVVDHQSQLKEERSLIYEIFASSNITFNNIILEERNKDT